MLHHFTYQAVCTIMQQLPNASLQVTKGERVKVLTEAEVEAHLTAIAEQD